MKQPVVLIFLSIAIVGAAYWLFTRTTPEQPVAETATEITPAAPEVPTDYIGLSEADAEALAGANGVMFRVVERDGQMLPTTRDFREGRISAVVENGMVVSYTVESMNPTPSAEEGSNPEDTPASVVEDDVAGIHDEIIGMTVADAEAYAATNNIPFRIGSVDGESRPVTMDYRPGRITASVVDGLVTEYTVE